jgi:hypothetical protein
VRRARRASMSRRSPSTALTLQRVSDVNTLASLATAGGTLVLAIATYSATRSANRAARISEQALQAGLRPVLFNARPQDPPQKVGYVDDHWVLVRDGLAAVQLHEECIYLAIPLRNVAEGLAVLHEWSARVRPLSADERPDLTLFRRLHRDLYVPAGDISFWQAAIREREDELYAPLCEAIETRSPVSIDVLYGDHEGGQRTITRFYLTPRPHAPTDEQWLWMCSTSRHWNIDREDPR